MNNILRIIKETKNIDIFDLCYFFGKEKFNYINFPSSELPKKGILVRIIAFFAHALFSLNYDIRYLRIMENSDILFFANSKNQYDTLKPLSSKLNSKIFGINKECDIKLPAIFVYLISLIFLPSLIRNFINTNEYRKKTFSIGFDWYLMSYGLYAYFILLFGHLKNKKSNIIVVLANDHNVFNRVILIAAKASNLKTIYIQHSSVNDGFPPLLFDYAFLDGLISYNAYLKAGASKTSIFLTGNPKYDGYRQYTNNHCRVNNLGICTNTLDDSNIVLNVITRLKKDFPQINIVLRPHPADRNIDEIKEKTKIWGIIFSDSRIEKSLDYLSRVDAIIAGETGIHLDAAIMNVYPIYFEFNNYANIVDNFHFIENNLVDNCGSDYGLLQKLLKSISQNKPMIRQRAKPFISNIDTKYDGNSMELIIELLNCIQQEKSINVDKWENLVDKKNTAYKLKYS